MRAVLTPARSAPWRRAAAPYATTSRFHAPSLEPPGGVPASFSPSGQSCAVREMMGVMSAAGRLDASSAADATYVSMSSSAASRSLGLGTAERSSISFTVFSAVFSSSPTLSTASSPRARRRPLATCRAASTCCKRRSAAGNTWMCSVWSPVTNTASMAAAMSGCAATGISVAEYPKAPSSSNATQRTLVLPRLEVSCGSSTFSKVLSPTCVSLSHVQRALNASKLYQYARR
mmetsp:Transcript_29166/g.72081  ORF Transcript_29166/g.72081 Transcript_29166/m.72081 type:complete len:232 (-) Transcript_29166:3863-4558(-)